MEDTRRQRRDFLQNIIIVVLALSAVALFTQTQLYSLDANRYLGQLADADGGASGITQPADLAAPVRVAVTSAYGRYGNVTLTTADEEFTSALGRLLGDALGSAKSYTSCSGKDFQQALNTPSVYYDFLNPLPLSILAGLVGTSGEDSASARQLAVSDQGSAGVRLFLWDGESHYRVSSTAVSSEDLAAVVNRYEPGTAEFSFDEDDLNAAQLAPLSLLPTEAPALPVLTATIPISETNLILSTFAFNPRTNYRYTESVGTEVVKEGDRALRIRADGTVLYNANGEAALTVEAADGEQPTAREAASGAALFLGSLLVSDDASPYLVSIGQSGGTTVLRFDYQAGGVPIRFSDGSCAAEVTLSGSVITRATLRLRWYSATADMSLLLPLRQAMAIAAKTPGAELSMGYADNGGATVGAGWLAD